MIILVLLTETNLAAAVPKVDFIASGGAEWIAYSWLAEISFAWILLQFGFSGLYLLPTLLVFLSALSIYNLFKKSF